MALFPLDPMEDNGRTAITDASQMSQVKEIRQLLQPAKLKAKLRYMDFWKAKEWMNIDEYR